MFKHLFFALLLPATALPALAQTPATASSAATGQYQYCQLISLGLYSRGARLEYGQHAKPAAMNPALDALDAAVKKLDSGIVALNYLTSQGWEYVSTTSLSPGTDSYIIYVLRRRTQ